MAPDSALGRLELDEHCKHLFAGAGLREEGVERIVTTSDRFVRGHLVAFGVGR